MGESDRADRKRERRERRSRAVRRRRLVAALLVLLLAGGAAAGAWLVTSGGADEEEGEAEAQDRERAQGMALDLQARQVVLSGSEATGRAAGGEEAERLEGMGGVILDSRNHASAEQMRDLTAALGRAGGDVAPIFAVQQEGGEYRELPDLPPADRQLNIGDEADPSLAREWARRTTAALARAGFDLALFPVADAATLDSPIADRAFSEDPELVASLTVAALEGCEASGVACAPLHFPGMGGASHDTALGPATVGLGHEELLGRDLIPFRAAIAEGVPAIVVSTAFYVAYDAVTPAALSPTVIEEVLRSELGYRGVAITDDLSTGAGRAAGNPASTAVEAIAAGADLVQLSDPRDAVTAARSIERSVRAGELPAERLTEAVARVVRLKRELGLIGEGG